MKDSNKKSTASPGTGHDVLAHLRRTNFRGSHFNENRYTIGNSDHH